MSNLAIFLFLVCVVLILLPPKYDPAIQLKQYFFDKNRKSNGNKN